MPAPPQAVDQQDIWKDDQMRHFSVCLIQHALARLNAREIYFTTDCVPASERVINGKHIGNGVPGSVITKLKHAHVIRAVGIIHAGRFYADSEKSARPDAKTRAVDKYELSSREAANEFLRRNNLKINSPQLELFNS